ncbi:MAG: zinc ribbon domain-containing protein [Anaerolineaceae bacterium]|nr:zinc ribbon domain-containing protein [Anaerolineaceae bacterium]
MPIYTYRCDNCGITFDKRQSFSDDPLKQCPECEEQTLHKVYQPVGIVFKGKGFYATDHRSASGAGKVSEHKSSENTGQSTSAASSTAAESSKPSTESKNSTTAKKAD